MSNTAKNYYILEVKTADRVARVSKHWLSGYALDRWERLLCGWRHHSSKVYSMEKTARKNAEKWTAI